MTKLHSKECLSVNKHTRFILTRYIDLVEFGVISILTSTYSKKLGELATLQKIGFTKKNHEEILIFKAEVVTR